MENSGRPYRARKGGWERGAAAADKAENWRTQDQGQGQSYRPNAKNPGGPYRASPRKGGQGPLSSSPGGFRSGQSSAQKDDPRWFPGLDNMSGSLEDKLERMATSAALEEDFSGRGPIRRPGSGQRQEPRGL
ncbi:hypothetical protein fugu_003730 [Takifugu bimaculatus]|uniref:Uncharacterized protein n=1 Tax=Takifugu bimaculatus TaxID=433685 RepID=A0A4Z2BDG7_9TELE|nr:hypothetical protein fugu_003730 [Takifugu bimaculatus]